MTISFTAIRYFVVLGNDSPEEPRKAAAVGVAIGIGCHSTI